MQLDHLQLTALVAAAVVVIARDQTRWIQGVAIAQLVGALLLILLAGNFLRLPISHVDLVLAFAAFAGWAAVLFLGGNKTTMIAGAIAAWIGFVMTLTELGWVRVDALRRLLRL